jgi:hypothetical protein
MSSNNGNSGVGGVSNLRAIFESKASEDRSASPPSRGRSPALSDASIHSRPVSKVRASFVAVERPSDIEEGQHWGLRKASDVTNMAENKQELVNGSLVNGSPNQADSNSQLNGVHTDPEPQSQGKTTDEPTPNGLGSILKGSAFEGSPPMSRSKVNGTGTRESPKSPTSQKKSLAASRMNGNTTPMSQTKSIGSRIKDAVSSNHNQPPPPARLNTTKDAKPIKLPPTRQIPPSKPLTRSPTSPKTPRTPVSPKMEKPLTRGSAAKPVAVVESAKNAASPEQAKKSPILPRETKRTSLNTQGGTAARHAPSSPRTNGAKKATSPEVKPRSTRVPASAAAPTAASAAKSSNATSLARKSTVTRRDHPPVKPAMTTAPAVKKMTRTSLPTQTGATDRTKSATSTGRRPPAEGFLARMMRPTASSAQKAHEKVAPSSPPQSKRAAPVHTAKRMARSSLNTSDEDKENTHRGGQESDIPPSTTEARADEVNGNSKTDSSPLKDITPIVEPDVTATESKMEGMEASTG